MEVLCVLAGLVILLVGVAVIGHLLWLAGAAVFGNSPAPPSLNRCPACASKLVPGQIRCRKCSFTIGARQATLDQELTATRRQLERLKKAKKISAATWETVSQAIREDVRERTIGFDPSEEPLEIVADARETLPTLPPAADRPGTNKEVVSAFEPIEVESSASNTATAQTLASTSVPAAPPKPSPEARRRRALADVLQAFMEERNIRWAELVSGLLIVVSSVGLVISLWATLKEAIPYFPVAVFLTATAAMHGAGLYTLHRWRLKSTSRGLLLISTLLIPLNVLAAMVLNDKRPAYGTIDYIAFAIGLSVLSAIAVSAARVLNRRNPWPLVIAVVGTAIGMSITGRLARSGDELEKTLVLFALPFLTFVTGACAHLVALARGRWLPIDRVTQSFRFFGIAGFSLALAGGLLAHKCVDVRQTLSLLSPMVAVVAATITGAGLIVHKRVTDSDQAAFRLAGTSIALGGGLLGVAALVLAWPRPDLLVAVGLFDALAFAALAWLAAFPALDVVATGAFSLAFLVGFEWGLGHITVAGATSELLTSLLLTARSALVLALLSLALDLCGAAMRAIQSRARAAAYFTSAVLHEAISIGIAVFAVSRDLPDQDLATLVFVLVAARWLIATWWLKRTYAGWIAATLLLAAISHGLAMNDSMAQALATRGVFPADPWKMSLLIHATICLGCAMIARRTSMATGPSVPGFLPAVLRFEPFRAAAIVTSALAVPLMLDLRDEHFLTHGVYAFWASAIWFVIAVLEGKQALAIASQVLATVAVTLGVTGFCQRQLWWTGRFTDPLLINSQLAALAVWSGLWITVRGASRRVTRLARVLKCEPTSVDRVLLGGVVAGLVATCLMAAWPGVLTELAASLGDGLRRPYIVAVLLPFGVGAILATSFALSPGRWRKAAAESLVLVVLCTFFLVMPASLPGWTWPGTPSPYGEGWGAGAWIALPLAFLALVAANRERSNVATLTGLALLVSAVPFLFACRWDAELRTATALQFGSAILALAVAAVWSFRRRPTAQAQAGEMRPVHAERTLILRDTLIAASALPVVILASHALFEVFGAGLTPFEPGNSLTLSAPYLTYCGPLGILTAAFVIHAINDRRVAWGMAATFLGQFAIGFSAGLSLLFSSQLDSVAELARFLQVIGLVAVVASAIWFCIEAFIRRRADRFETQLTVAHLSVRVQLTAVAAFVGLLTVGATIGLWLSPGQLPEGVRECGTPLGWIFLLAATGVWLWHSRESWPLAAVRIAVFFLPAAAVFGGASLGLWNSANNWLSFHAAMVGWCAVLTLAAAATVATRQPDRRRESITIANRALLLLPVILLFAAESAFLDPQRPWWAAGAAIWLSLCLAAMAVGAKSALRSYASLVLAVLGAICIGADPWLRGEHPTGWRPIIDAVHITILGLALHGLVWLAIELTRRVWRTRPIKARGTPLVHHSAAAIGTLLLGVIALVALVPHPFFVDFVSATPLAWVSLAVLAALAAGSLWERRAEHPFPILYVLGLIAIAMFLDWRNFDGRQLIFAAAASGASYIVLTGALWTIRRPLKTIGLRLAMSRFAIDAKRVTYWLEPVTLTLAALVIGVEFWTVLTFDDTPLRVGGALATLATAGGLALLASSRSRQLLQTAALSVGAIAAVQFGWSLMDPIGSAQHEELRRAIRAMAMLGAATFVYGFPLVRFAPAGSTWFSSIRRTAIGVAATTIATLALVLVSEIVSFDALAGAPETVGECILVAVTLALLAAGLLSLALLPGRDPFFQSERQRFLYVYAAEVVCGLLFAHLYLTNPEFFRHRLQPYWPLVVMAIAYAGTAASELFRRMKVGVLAEPLEYSAAFLPVLPVIGFWFMGSQLNYSSVLVVIGLLYLFLSLRRGTWVYPAAAAVVGNATLCSLLYDNGVSLLFHPQMFVIPPCLTILAAAQLNRDRLEPQGLASIRYFAMTAIYVSSTGEMFQHGIGTTLWLPMVLAGLSVLGVLAGIVLRVRAFLYLGTSFLLLSIVSMVWHAARSIGHVWPWWVFLFALGLGLLTLFGIFEKKRPEVLALVGSLREWEG